MEYFAFSKAAPKPCLRCNATEVRVLQQEYERGTEEFWLYRVPVYNRCRKCDSTHIKDRYFRYAGSWCSAFCVPPIEMIDIPIKLETVGVIERAIHSSSLAEKGSEIRSHGTFISHLTTLKEPELYKQALCSWAPTAMMAFMENKPGVSRKVGKATFKQGPPPAFTEGEKEDSPTAPKTSAALKPSEDEHCHLPANPDCDGKMVGTQLKGDEYGESHESNKLVGEEVVYDKKILATQIGPDIIPTEVMDATFGNMKAAAAKRIDPLPFQADKRMIRRIERMVTKVIDEVFTYNKIARWRENVPDFADLRSKKWSADRFRRAWDEAFYEPDPRIEQTFQIKTNEALPAKDKAPRIIINCGDRAQVLMKLPVKCFEELLFEHFEDASIKHLPKHEAMGRVAGHLRQRNGHIIEGDGSAWDACCNATIRSMTENRVIEHIINCLGHDKDCPKNWFSIMLQDLKKMKLKGKGKTRGWAQSPIRVCIEAIRQSGHGGTSCFNWFINYIAWTCVLAENPENLVRLTREKQLPSWYQSARDFKWYEVKFAFEGDDSALSTTENLENWAEWIEKKWTDLGFRMKLVYVDKKLTFTGFDFLCDENGPTGIYIPEIARNIASSSWSTSSELKSHPEELHKIAAAAMLARAQNFRDCGAYSRYFAALGLAHARQVEDFGLGEVEALRLGIQVSPSVLDDLQVRYDAAMPMNPRVKALVDLVAPFGSTEAELRMLNCDFGTDPFDHRLARELIPKTVWDPAKFSAARR